MFFPNGLTVPTCQSSAFVSLHCLTTVSCRIVSELCLQRFDRSTSVFTGWRERCVFVCVYSGELVECRSLCRWHGMLQKCLFYLYTLGISATSVDSITPAFPSFGDTNNWSTSVLVGIKLSWIDWILFLLEGAVLTVTLPA